MKMLRPAELFGAKRLDELMNALNSYPDDLGKVDMCDLPVFGGKRPVNPDGVWSWDETRLLIADGWGGWALVERT